MRRILWGAAFAFYSLSHASASAWVNSPCCSFSYCDWNIATDVELSAGYRQDNLHWSIADPTGTPNILAELQWKDIQIAEVKAQGHVLLIDRIYLRASADFGRIFHGRNQDSVYAGDDKTLEISRSTARSDRGEVFDFSFGAGWQFYFCLYQDVLQVTPLFGYYYSEQQLQDHHGQLLINTGFSALGDELPFGPLGDVSGLHSNYRAKWRGTWLGVDLFLPISCWNVDLFATFEYHRIKYNGSGHWNLRSDFVQDFKHSASHGHGFYTAFGYRYAWCCNWYAGMTGSYSWMNSRHGTSRTYFAAGTETTRFNGATWHSWSLLVDAGLLF